MDAALSACKCAECKKKPRQDSKVALLEIDPSLLFLFTL